jgi:hypothetical protein
MFTFGSFWFLPDASETWGIDAYFWGCWLFIIGSLITCIMAARGIFLAVDEEGEFAKMTLHTEKSREERNEFFESILFFVSGLIFFVGSVLFMPPPTSDRGWIGLEYGDKESKEYGEMYGAYFFIIGSYGFVISGFFNGYGKSHSDEGMSESPSAQMKVFLLKKYGLMCVVLGSAFFVVGSFLYRPGLSKSCSETRIISAEAEKTGHEMCIDSGKYGTWLYIYGSLLFLLETIFALIVLVIKHISHNEEIAHGLKEGEVIGSESEG